MTATDRREFLGQCLQTGIGISLAASLASAAEGSKKHERIRIGQIGVGHAHAAKLEIYRQLPDYEVVGIVEEDEQRRTQASSQSAFKDLPWMTREQLLNAPDLQVVLVETAVRDLLSTAQQCVRAGKHVGIDKPAGTSLPLFRSILKDAEQQQLLVQMGYMYRYNPGVLLLHELLRHGWLGDVFEVHAVMSKVLTSEQRQRLTEYSGGIMLELGCHLIDLVAAILGKPDEVFAVAQHSSSSDDGLLDNMLAVFRYPRASATIKSSGLEVEGGDRRHLVVCGTEGTLHIQPLDNPSARLALSRSRGNYRQGYQDIKFPQYTRYIADAIDMARILRGEKAADYSYEHDLIVQECVLRASQMSVDL
jgi:predicted dehydrogenase